MSAAAPHEPAAPETDGPPFALAFEQLPRAWRVRAFGVDYAHVRPAGGGDLYVTRFGWPRARQLLPERWYEGRWFAEHGEKLPGASGHVYHVRTRPDGGRPLDLVVKFSRMAQEVPVVTEGVPPGHLPDDAEVAGARFNSPMEEFGLVMELREAACAARGVRVPTQRPLAIWAPPEPFDLWELGRSDGRFHALRDMLARDQEEAARAIELDIRRLYIVLYSWIDGLDAEAVHAWRGFGEAEFAAFAPRVERALARAGFRVLDNKPRHYILRRRGDGILRDRAGRPVYGLVDFEFLQRTGAGERRAEAGRRERFWTLRARAPAAAPDGAPVEVLGVGYRFHPLPDGGRLWVRGEGADLADYFEPDRWRRTPRARLSGASQVFRTRTRDGLHVVYRLSRCGVRPDADPLTAHGRRIRAHGFNSPFEEFALAAGLRAAGVGVVTPYAIYRTGHASARAAALRDPCRFASHAGFTAPCDPPEAALADAFDYWTIWEAFRGVAAPAGVHGGIAGVLDLGRARDDGLIAVAEHDAALDDARRRIATLGMPADDLVDEDLGVRADGRGGLVRDAAGPAMRLAIDALAAWEFGLLGGRAYRALVRGVGERLRAAGFEKLDPSGRHLLLAMDPDGVLDRDAGGTPLVVLANVALVRALEAGRA